MPACKLAEDVAAARKGVAHEPPRPAPAGVASLDADRTGVEAPRPGPAVGRNAIDQTAVREDGAAPKVTLNGEVTRTAAAKGLFLIARPPGNPIIAKSPGVERVEPALVELAVGTQDIRFCKCRGSSAILTPPRWTGGML